MAIATIFSTYVFNSIFTFKLKNHFDSINLNAVDCQNQNNELQFSPSVELMAILFCSHIKEFSTQRKVGHLPAQVNITINTTFSVTIHHLHKTVVYTS